MWDKQICGKKDRFPAVPDTITEAVREAGVNGGIIGVVLLIELLGFCMFHFEGLCKTPYINVSFKLFTLRTCLN
jgi:hypothetical protein